MSRLRAVRRCAVAVLLGVSLASFAQGYPAKPIRLIVPYAQAGGTDISARIVAQKMSEEIRQQIIVENRVGAGGIVGTEAAAKLPGDGYTVLLVSATTLCIVPFLFSNLPYDPVNSFVPEWVEFDLDQAEWRIPAERMKAREQHIVPLSKQAVAILR
jgi:tripartite-type tricarboxylate transporter receptor subunit TctC